MNNLFSTGVLVVLALLPAYLLRVNIFGIPMTLLEIMLLILIILWLIQNRKRLKDLFVIKRSWAIFLALVIIAATISAIIAPDTLSAFGIWKAYFIEPILFFYLLIDLLQRKQITNESVITALCVGGLLVALTAILQWILWTGIPIPWDIERRVTGLFDYPNALGLYLGPLVILIIGRLIYLCHCEVEDRSNLIGLLRRPIWPPRNDKTLLYFISIVLFTIAIILAQSEAALASIIITTIIMGVSHNKFRKQTIIISCVALLLLFSIPTTRVLVINKVSLQDYSGQVRLSQWKETVELLKDHPIVGAGLSGYPNALKPYHKDTQFEIFQYPHNIFLNIWVELGLLGLLIFVVLISLMIKKILSLRRGQRADEAIFGNDVTLSLFPILQIFIHGLVDVPYFKNDLAILTWTIFAILYVQSFSTKIKS